MKQLKTEQWVDLFVKDEEKSNCANAMYSKKELHPKGTLGSFRGAE